MPLQGQCLCGNVKVTIADGSLPLVPRACHCNNCKATAGSIVSFVAVVSLDDLTIDGEPNEYRDSATDSGNTTSRFFCGRCGSPVHTQGPSRPGKTVVKLGLFARDGLKLDKPVAQLFTKNRHAWEVPYEGAEQHEGMPKAA